MVHNLRNRHRMTFIVLAIVIPAGFVASIAGRKPIPTDDRVSQITQPETTQPSQFIFSEDDLWQNHPIQTKAFFTDSVLTLELTPQTYLAYPDLLVYWHSGATNSEALPQNAYLLGAQNNNAASLFTLPANAAGSPGTLVLYSLAQQQVIDQAALALKLNSEGGF